MAIWTEPIEASLREVLVRGPHTVWISPTLSLAGFGRKTRIDPGTGPGRFERARWLFTEWASRQEGSDSDLPGPFAFASFTFDEADSSSVVVVPEMVVASDGDRSWLVSHGPTRLDWRLLAPRVPTVASADRPRFAGSSLPDHLWLEAVAGAIKTIEAGVIEKVVLARDHALWSKEPFDLHRILERLHARFPQCFVFLVEDLVGASPELLIRHSKSTVSSRALAGSVRRHPDPEVDDQLGADLLKSTKDLHEHALAAGSVGSVLGQVCRTLDRAARPDLLKLENVQHLATSFHGTLAAPRHVLELVSMLHPTAAVGGTPTQQAVEMIAQLEGMDRGRYAGPVGVFDTTGDGEFAIALRCAEISGARARLFAGAGLVAGSVPEDELEETRLKLRAMLSALE